MAKYWVEVREDAKHLPPIDNLPVTKPHPTKDSVILIEVEEGKCVCGMFDTMQEADEAGKTCILCT